MHILPFLFYQFSCLFPSSISFFYSSVLLLYFISFVNPLFIYHSFTFFLPSSFLEFPLVCSVHFCCPSSSLFPLFFSFHLSSFCTPSLAPSSFLPSVPRARATVPSRYGLPCWSIFIMLLHLRQIVHLITHLPLIPLHPTPHSPITAASTDPGRPARPLLSLRLPFFFVS